MILLFIALFLSVVGVEAFFRRRERGVEFLADERLYRSVPGQRGTNASGFHERDVPPAASGQRRIAVLGDSMTWGQGTADETWPRELERSLGAAWQVLNFARYGSDTRQQLATLPEVWTYQPERLLVGVYWNDAIPTRMVEVGGRAGRVWLADRPWPWRHSAAFRAIHGAWASRGYQPEPEQGYVARYLGAIADEASRRGVVTTAVLLWPHALARGVTDCAVVTQRAKDCLLARETTRSLRAEIEALGVPVVDTLPALVEPTSPATNPMDWEHPGPAADARIGRFVAESLAAELGDDGRRR